MSVKARTIIDDHKDRPLDAQSVSRAWDSSMHDILSSSSSTTARTIRTCPVLPPTYPLFIDNPQTPTRSNEFPTPMMDKCFKNNFSLEMCEHLHHLFWWSCHVASSNAGPMQSRTRPNTKRSSGTSDSDCKLPGTLSLFCFHQVYPENEEDQAPYFSLTCLHNNC